jgi:histidyl-tRNA synthetase
MTIDPETESPAAEMPLGQVLGTRDWLPEDFAALARLEATLMACFAQAGYAPMRTPVLEYTELHERKSGAGIVSKLYELGGGSLCLRPELTASIVRAYTAAAEPPALPWRVSLAGPVFRHEPPRPHHYREFQQVGVEMLGASGPEADGEVIWLADWALGRLGLPDAAIRLGDVGLILEILDRSGLPASARSALVETLSEAAAEGRNVRALEAGLDQLFRWLRASDTGEIPLPVDRADDLGIDRLFRTLVPVVTGRRSGHEILHRLRRKWELGHTLLGALERVRAQVHELADLKGPAQVVLDRLGRDFEDLAPDSVAALRALVAALGHYGIKPDRIELDLGFGRGIGFYSQMVFELVVATPSGPVEVCGGGRYDGLARVLGSDRDDRGVGFAFGLERLLHVLAARGQGHRPGESPPSGFLIVATRPEVVGAAVRLATYLRSKGGRAVLETRRPLAEALTHAEALGLARVVAVAGPMEDPGTLTLHDLARRTRTETVAYALRELVRDETEGRRR